MHLLNCKWPTGIAKKSSHFLLIWIFCSGGFCRNEVAPLDAEAGEAVGETAVQTVTDGPENPGQNGTANGNALPRKLPPLQPHELSEEVKHLNAILIHCFIHYIFHKSKFDGMQWLTSFSDYVLEKSLVRKMMSKGQVSIKSLNCSGLYFIRVRVTVWF